jgi:shikimate kinase
MEPTVKIFFIGMPGSGKSTIGKQIANSLNIPFVDLDNEIERQEKMTIAEIFKTKGEDHFRKTESSLLNHWASSPNSFVMATGGGAPCFFNGIDVIKNSGVSVFLDEPIPTLAKRVTQQTGRPLLSSNKEEETIEKLKKTFSARVAIYKKATFTMENPTVDKVLEKLKHLKDKPSSN